MCGNSYEEYMNYLLGHSPKEEVIVEAEKLNTYDAETENEYIDLYPDIYKIVYPVVCKKCIEIEGEITEETVNQLTNEIYEIIEVPEKPSREYSFHQKSNGRVNREYMGMQENRSRNFLLQDLIKILLLRELIGGGRMPKPPRPGPGMTPPRPGDGHRPPPLPPRF